MHSVRPPKLNGQRAIVTGACDGIGYETAAILASRGATVTLGCRASSPQFSATATHLSRIGDVSVLPLDLASMSSVHEFAVQAAGKSSTPLSMLDARARSCTTLRSSPPERAG